MTRILQLGKFYPIRGGVEEVMMIFTEGLDERGYSCDMLCASHDGEVDDIILSEQSRIMRTNTLMKAAATMISPEMILRLRRICHRYDLIHIHHPDPMATLALWLSGYKGKVILHWHSDILKQKHLLRLFLPLQRWLIRRADLILGTTPVYVSESPFLREVQDKVNFLPIGVDPYPWLADEIEAIRATYPGKKIIFNMGRLVPYKGYHHLIETMSLLGEEYILLIGGDGPLRAELEERIRELGLVDRVKLLGFIPSKLKPAYFGACDVFCLSSILKTEAYAIVLVEAMSLARPVIATKIPESGVSWVNADGESGLNVPIEDSEAMASAIRTICEDPILWEQYSRGARRRFYDVFTKDEMINNLIEIYANLLSN
jgi:glycosyltransferase